MKKIMDRIKKTVTRFKKWLIRKLGGYTEIFETVTRTEVVAFPVQPKKIMAACDVYTDWFNDSQRLANSRSRKDFVEKELLSGMSKTIIDSMYVERTDDPRNCRIHFRASLWVVPAPDAMKVEQVINKMNNSMEV